MWPESVFQTPVRFLFQNFWIRVRVRLLFKFKNLAPVRTPATIINPTLIYPCFYLRNDDTDPCFCPNWKLTPDPGPEEKRRILPESPPVNRTRYQAKFLTSAKFLTWCCFSSQNKEIRCGNYFFDVCCVNYNIFVGYQVPTTSYSTGVT